MNFCNIDDINDIIRKIPGRYRSKYVIIMGSTAFRWVGWKKKLKSSQALGALPKGFFPFVLTFFRIASL